MPDDQREQVSGPNSQENPNSRKKSRESSYVCILIIIDRYIPAKSSK